MTRRMPRAFSVAVAASLSATATQVGWAQDGIPFDEANVFAELNDTDGDLGLHALVDGEAWRRLSIEDPNGRQILLVRPQRRLARQGLTELFFESDEPSFDELTPEAFFQRFPEGRYTISGRTIEGDELESTASFSHRMPAPADNVAVSGAGFAEDCEEVDPPVVSEPVVISWDPVTTSHPEIGNPNSAPIRIDRYQVVVEREEPTLLIHSVDLPGDLPAYEITVPSEFIALGEEFKYEILVRAMNGNQTALESCFAVE
jgi:hypothetical protein